MSVFVLIEQSNGRAAPVSWEALGAAQQLAEAVGGPVTAVVFGHNVGDVAQAAFAHGADDVLLADHATLATYRLEPYAALLARLVEVHKPRAVVAGATTRGRDVLGSAAFDVGAGLLADVTALDVADGAIQATRPVYAGKLLSTEVSAADVTFITVRARAFQAPEPDPGRRAGPVTVPPVLSEDAIATKEARFEAAAGGVNLTDAAIIVSGGRAVGSPEGFAPLHALADVLGAAVGATRAAVDAGYIPYAHQVGQTGKVVSPDLYIACGISGAIQHQAGMRTAKVIVAINKDPDAPIFKLARYGIVGDLFEIVPALTQAFRAKLGR